MPLLYWAPYALSNLSITQGVFPHELKVAKVIPLFKSNDPMVFSNYRPVSVLPLLSKIFERLMYNRLLSFVNKCKLLYEYQFGFRCGHSPELALTCLVDKISNALENGEYVLELFLDFSKAFDTVNHDILFEKLEYLGIRDIDGNHDMFDQIRNCLQISPSLPDGHCFLYSIIKSCSAQLTPGLDTDVRSILSKMNSELAACPHFYAAFMKKNDISAMKTAFHNYTVNRPTVRVSRSAVPKVYRK